MQVPLCPHCGNLVVNPSGIRKRELYGSTLVWNEAWYRVEPQCVACGYKFTASSHLKTGHASPLKASESEITIQPGVSFAWTFLDYLDYQPFIEIQIKREFAGEVDGLAKVAQIRLTPQEWQEIAQKLQTDLLPLTQQNAWWVDTT